MSFTFTKSIYSIQKWKVDVMIVQNEQLFLFYCLKMARIYKQKRRLKERKEHTIAESKQKQEKRVISDANSYLLYGHSIEITDDVLLSERRFLWTIDGGIQFTYRRKNL